jgi:hypothetical protein
MTGKKTGGRQKGTANKVGGSIRQQIKDFIEAETESVLDEIYKLEGKEKIEMYFKLLKYVVPPMQATQQETVSPFQFVPIND